MRSCGPRWRRRLPASPVGAGWPLNGRGLFPPARLNLDIDVDERNRGGRDSGNTRSLPDGLRLHLAQLLLHFARQAADGVVVEPLGDVALLGFFQAVNSPLLLVEIAGIFDFGF